MPPDPSTGPAVPQADSPTEAFEPAPVRAPAFEAAPTASTTVPAFEPVAPEAAPTAAAVTPASSRPRGGGSGGRLLNVALGIAVLVAAAGVAFAVGRASAPATAASGGTVIRGLGNGGAFPDASFDLNGVTDGGGAVPGGVSGGAGDGGPRGGFGLGGGLTIEGTVDSVTADSLTVTTSGGQTITIGLDADTTYHEQADASAADVADGSTVVVRVEGGFRGPASGGGGGASLGSASDVTVVP